MVTHTFNPSTWKEKQVDLCAFEAILVYIASPGIARATHLHCVQIRAFHLLGVTINTKKGSALKQVHAPCLLSQQPPRRWLSA